MWKFLRNRVESEVALRNAFRQGRRHSNMAAVLMLGIALSLLMTSVFNYQDNYLERDIARTFGGHLQFRAESPFTKQEIHTIREEKRCQGYNPAGRGFGDLGLWKRTAADECFRGGSRVATIISVVHFTTRRRESDGLKCKRDHFAGRLCFSTMGRGNRGNDPIENSWG